MVRTLAGATFWSHLTTRKVLRLRSKKSRRLRSRAGSAGTIWEKVGSRHPATQTEGEEGGNWIR